MFTVVDGGGEESAGNNGDGQVDAVNHGVDVDAEAGVGENQIHGEVELEALTNQLSEYLNRSLSLQSHQIVTGGLENDFTRYIESDADGSSAERETSSDSNGWQINWDACKAEFVYSDLDSLENELGEIYGYYELGSLSYNFDMFRTYVESKNIEHWFTSKSAEKINFLDDVLDDLELVDEYRRSDAILAISYLIQGCWKDLETGAEQLSCIEENVLLLLQCNGFWRIWQLFACVKAQIENDGVPWAWGLNERILDNCLSILCTITSVSLRKRDHSVVQGFLSEIKTAEGDSVLATVLDSFVKFVVQLTSRSYLLKKLLLLARNLLLLSAGDSDDLRKLKDKCRQAAGLKPCKEDTVFNCRQIEILQKNPAWNELKDINMMTLEDFEEYTRYTDLAAPGSTVAGENSCKSLPWSSKSSIGVLGACLREGNNEYKGRGQSKLPIWMEQKVDKLGKHLHIPLSAFQLQQEQLIREYPKVFEDQESPFVERTEEIFLALLPILECSTNAMIMLLYEAAPLSTSAQVHPSNSKVNPPFIPRYGGDATYFVEDSIRQAEIIVKAISAIFILLLKHLKTNHILQFEFLASEITTACFIPTVLRFFNRDVYRDVCQRPTLLHPQCPFKAISVDLCLDPGGLESINYSSVGQFGLSWRNMFSYINILRILNKIVKGKPARILMLRMFNAHICLKRCLNVKDSMLQQYTLKLFKLQCNFLDQDWKRNNQRIISAIYHKVRHRLLDNWIGEISSSNKMKKRLDRPRLKIWPWDHNEAEARLHKDIILYLVRRYDAKMSNTNEEDGISNELNSSEHFGEVVLHESFHEKYERWLEVEVFNKNMDWDNLLYAPHLV